MTIEPKDIHLQSTPGPTSIRYPKANVQRIAESRPPIELGKSEVIDWGHDGMIIAYEDS